jgi:hypothetical protein
MAAGDGKEYLAAPSDRAKGAGGRPRFFNIAKALPEDPEADAVGILYQSGWLWSSMTLAENVGLPLGGLTDLTERHIREIASLKLVLVGLKGFEGFFPSEIGGDMQQRAGLARAMALHPDILFFHKRLDPVSSHLRDELTDELRDNLRRHDRDGYSRAHQYLMIGNNSNLPGRRLGYSDCDRRPSRDAGPFHGPAGA